MPTITIAIDADKLPLRLVKRLYEEYGLEINPDTLEIEIISVEVR